MLGVPHRLRLAAPPDGSFILRDPELIAVYNSSSRHTVQRVQRVELSEIECNPPESKATGVPLPMHGTGALSHGCVVQQHRTFRLHARVRENVEYQTWARSVLAATGRRLWRQGPQMRMFQSPDDGLEGGSGRVLGGSGNPNSGQTKKSAQTLILVNSAKNGWFGQTWYCPSFGQIWPCHNGHNSTNHNDTCCWRSVASCLEDEGYQETANREPGKWVNARV